MFELNGIIWDICFVNPYDYILYDIRNNVITVATTDLYTHTIYIANNVSDEFLLKILKHELYHCYEFSGLAYDLPTFYEEHTADFIANRGNELLDLASDIYNVLTYYK